MTLKAKEGRSDVVRHNGMPQISRTSQRWIALFIWALGLCTIIIFALWNLHDSKSEAENRLISEAGRASAQIASLLTLLGWEPDKTATQSIIAGAMEDERIYAIRIERDGQMLGGQRRNYLWEPIAWDDEIAENCVQGINPLKIGGKSAGKVEVWLSPRLDEEENAMLSRRELWRTVCIALIWTVSLVLIFWSWGDMRRLKIYFRKKSDGAAPKDPGKILQNLNKDNIKDGTADIMNLERGRHYQCRHPESALVTAGMFRQTFARGPALISRLYSEGETAGLCHLGRMLEQAAPCIGAQSLEDAAIAMQRALNDPDCKTRALPVEKCAKTLEQVLDTLCGDGQWRSKSGNRS